MNENKTMDIYSRGEGENNMQTLPISEETREKLEDATLSVFMDQYAKALDAGVDSLMEDCAEDTFPPELDQRIRKLIAKESAKERNKKRRKTALRMLRSAAAAIVLLLGACSVLFVTVEAFRIPVMNFFMEKTNLYWEISTGDGETKEPETFNEENPLEGILSQEFELVFLDGSLESGNLIADYSSDKEASVSLYINFATGNNQTDTENAAASKFKLAGQDAVISIEGEVVRITWINYDIAKVFSLRTVNVDENEAIDIAANLVSLF